MLVLTRKVGEGIAIGDDIKIIVMQIKGKQVRLGVKASSNTIVHREEVYQRIQSENRDAAQAQVESLSEVVDIIGKDDKADARSPFRKRIRNREES